MFRLITWYWFQEKAQYHYTAEDVNVWAAMMRRNITVPCELACVTDKPAGIDSSFVERMINLWRGKNVALVSEKKTSIYRLISTTGGNFAHIKCPSHKTFAGGARQILEGRLGGRAEAVPADSGRRKC